MLATKYGNHTSLIKWWLMLHHSGCVEPLEPRRRVELEPRPSASARSPLKCRANERQVLVEVRKFSVY
jgi:hypothetical protein